MATSTLRGTQSAKDVLLAQTTVKSVVWKMSNDGELRAQQTARGQQEALEMIKCW